MKRFAQWCTVTVLPCIAMLTAPSMLAAGGGGESGGSKLHIEVSWTTDVPAGFTLRDADGRLTVVNETDQRNEIPNCQTTVSAQSGTFDIDPMDPRGYSMTAFVFKTLPECSPGTIATIDWYLDGCLVQTYTLPMACYPINSVGYVKPGDPCLPKVYLDVDGSFSVTAPQDDLKRLDASGVLRGFVPGSDLAGNSVTITPTQPQKVKVYVVPPSGAKGSVLLELLSVSNYPGIAGNYPIPGDSNKDMDFGLGIYSKSLSIPRSGYVSVEMNVRDYAAKGILRVTVPNGRSAPGGVIERAIPFDADGNSIPDAGWNAAGQAVSPVGLSPSDDDDAAPLASGLPTAGIFGDGLTRFEEYRGFVAEGNHKRLDPAKKDVFVRLDPLQVQFASGLNVLPVKAHVVRPSEAQPAEYTPIINVNSTSVMPGAMTPQAAVTIRESTANDIFFHDKDDNVFPVYAQLAGKCWTVDEDLHNTFEIAQGKERKSPNETLIVDIYPRKLVNDALYFPGVAPPILGDDVLDPINNPNLITPGPNRVLDSVPASPGDFLAELVAQCGVNPAVYVVNVAATNDGSELRKTILAHETLHALDVEHGGTCGEMMWTEYDRILSPPPLTFPRSLTGAEQSQIRAHRKQ